MVRTDPDGPVKGGGKWAAQLTLATNSDETEPFSFKTVRCNQARPGLLVDDS
jgi:hypothetical protein